MTNEQTERCNKALEQFQTGNYQTIEDVIEFYVEPSLSKEEAEIIIANPWCYCSETLAIAKRYLDENIF